MSNSFSVSRGGAGASQIFLAQAVGGPGPAARAKRPVLSIAQLPLGVRDAVQDRSDPTGRAAIPPWRFTQAAKLLTGRDARVDGGEDDPYFQERANDLRPAKPAGYDPELLASSRIRSLVELDGAFDRWWGLPSPTGVKQLVNDLVALRKSEFASSAAKQDSAADHMAGILHENPLFSSGFGPKERSMRVWRKDGTPDQATLVEIANPGNKNAFTNYREAWKEKNAAELRVRALSSLLSDQIKSGRVDLGALIREAPGLRWALRSAQKNIMLRPLSWGQEP